MTKILCLIVLAFGVKLVWMMNIPHTASFAIKPLALPTWALAKQHPMQKKSAKHKARLKSHLS